MPEARQAAGFFNLQGKFAVVFFDPDLTALLFREALDVLAACRAVDQHG
jgi:hypothetical protein